MTKRPRTTPALAVACTLFAAGVLLAGCTPTSTAPTEAPASQPSTQGAQTGDQVFHGTRHEYTQAVAACLQEAGWDVEVSPEDVDGGRSLIVDTPPEQNDEFDAALQACHVELGPLEQGFDEPGALRRWYDFQVERLACLDSAGWVAEPPPSFESVEDEYATDGVIMWNPEAGVPDADLEKARAACPDTEDF